MVNSFGGNFFLSIIIHSIFGVFIRLMYDLGGFRTIFDSVFGISNYAGKFNYSSLIGDIFKYNDFSIKIWLEFFLYRYSIIVLMFSLIFTLIFCVMYRTKKSGDDLTPTWNIFAIILLFICLVGGIAYTPIVDFGLLIFSYITYLLVGFLPFYLSTLILCGTTAVGSYKIKKRFS